MTIYERTSILVSLTLLGLLAYFLIELPSRAIELTLFGSPLTLGLSQRGLMALLVGGMATTGTQSIIRDHPNLPRHVSGYAPIFWILPGMLIILATLWLPLLAADVVRWAIGMVVTGALLWFVVLAEYHTVDPDSPPYELARLWLSLLGYGVAFGFFIIIYQTRARSALSATEVMLVGTLLAASLLHAGPAQARLTWLFAAITGLVLGQSTWALNFWRVSPLTAGLWLLLIFYLFSGFAQQHLLGRLSRRALIEFAAVAVVGVFAILRYAP